MNNPKVSFLFPTRNRKDLVRELLTRLYALSGPEREVIVVDDASKDSTWAMIQREFPQVKGFRNEVQSNHNELQRAVGLASGDYVFKLDDDSWPAEGTLEKVVAHFEARGPKLGLVALPVHDATSGRLGYTTYYPEVPEGERYAPTYGFRNPGVVFRSLKRRTH